MIHIPILRRGEPYRSEERQPLPDLATGEPVAEVGQANPGLIGRDLAGAAEARRALEELSVSELVAISKRAGRLFMEAELPLGDDSQTPDDYIRQLSATTGLPRVMARANMGKIHFVFDEMETVLGGLTRGLDLTALDRGWIEREGGSVISYRRQADVMGAVLPSNSPGVHSLWLPAIPLKVPLAIKPGGKEPWTPYRVIQAFLAAGCPPSAFGFYPTSYPGASELLLRCGRSLFFGSAATVGSWAGDERVQLHGPGWSKVLLGPDQAPSWRDHLELIAASVADNGGRSCINASGVWTAAHGRELAAGLAERLAAIEARPLDHPAAALAAMPSRQAAEQLSTYIDAQLEGGGAEDMTAPLRPAGRVAEAGGCWFVLPTVIHCDDPGHPLAQTELLFPFVSVVEVAPEGLPAALGDTLVLTALTADEELGWELMSAPNVERLNLGPIPTSRVSWDQPHEGNLFEHLYRQRALQQRPFAAESAAGSTTAGGREASA